MIKLKMGHGYKLIKVSQSLKVFYKYNRMVRLQLTVIYRSAGVYVYIVNIFYAVFLKHVDQL